MPQQFTKVIIVLMVIGLGFSVLINLSSILNPTLDTVFNTDDSVHPYSRVVTEALFWETDEKFLNICKENNLFIRMAAFQTTLPDPLPGEEMNVAIAADYLAGTLVEPDQVFSVLKVIGPFTLQRGYFKGPTYSGTEVIETIGGGVCKISTTVYNVAVLANLPIVERYNHSMLVPYVPPGQDATVWYPYKDLKFHNNTNNPLLIWADTLDNTLYVAIYGRVPAPNVTWHHKILQRQKTSTYHRYSINLKPGEEKVIIPGADGLTVKSWVTITNENGEIQTKKLGTDYYQPMPRVIEHGIAQ